MRKLLPTLLALCLCVACSPRDFLTRRLAGDLIAGSDTFSAPQQFWLRTGIVSNKDYTSPEYLVLERRGWLIGSNTPCPPEVTPTPCWDVALTPLGVDAFHDVIKTADVGKQSFTVPLAKRALVAITGISKDGNEAAVEFTWQWVPTNEVGSALTPSGIQYKSSVTFRRFDDGWRVLEGSGAKTNQSLEDALKIAVPAS